LICRSSLAGGAPCRYILGDGIKIVGKDQWHHTRSTAACYEGFGWDRHEHLVRSLRARVSNPTGTHCKRVEKASRQNTAENEGVFMFELHATKLSGQYCQSRADVLRGQAVPEASQGAGVRDHKVHCAIGSKAQLWRFIEFLLPQFGQCTFFESDRSSWCSRSVKQLGMIQG